MMNNFLCDYTHNNDVIRTPDLIETIYQLMLWGFLYLFAVWYCTFYYFVLGIQVYIFKVLGCN